MIRRAVQLEIFSLVWMVVETAVGISAGYQAHSLALEAFGADSVIELLAGGAVLWRMLIELRREDPGRIKAAERTASWTVAISLLLLAAYIVATAGYDLWTRNGAVASLPGLILAVAAAVIMPFLAGAKRRIGAAVGSQALQADGACSTICAYMAWALLVGVSLTTLFGWGWADTAASLVILYFAVREARGALAKAQGKDGTCGYG